MDIFLLNSFSNIKASAALADITFPSNVRTIFVLFIFVQALFGADGQITVFHFGFDFIFFEAGKVNVQLIAGSGIPNIGFHQVFPVLAIQGVAAV